MKKNTKNKGGDFLDLINNRSENTKVRTAKICIEDLSKSRFTTKKIHIIKTIVLNKFTILIFICPHLLYKIMIIQFEILFL